ncbi:hypothetical protein [Pseudoalteromonas rhizosphaerae]|nr:hypothetical protein [Pseudoalteromonas rhizosphaerae]
MMVSATRSLRAQRFTWNDDGTPNFAKAGTNLDQQAFTALLWQMVP